MLVGLVLPTSFLKTYGHLSPVKVALAPHVLRDENYRHHFLNSQAILDCSGTGIRKSVSPEDLASAIALIYPGVVILPNFDFDSQKTITYSVSFLTTYEAFLKSYSVKTIGVVQAAEKREWTTTYKRLSSIVDIIGIPAHSLKFGDRSELLEHVGCTKPVYFLDFWEDPIWELEELNRYPHFKVLITSFPVRLAVSGRTIYEISPTPPPLDVDNQVDTYPELTQRNINELLQECRSGTKV